MRLDVRRVIFLVAGAAVLGNLVDIRSLHEAEADVGVPQAIAPIVVAVKLQVFLLQDCVQQLPMVARKEPIRGLRAIALDEPLVRPDSANGGGTGAAWCPTTAQSPRPPAAPSAPINCVHGFGQTGMPPGPYRVIASTNQGDLAFVEDLGVQANRLLPRSRS